MVASSKLPLVISLGIGFKMNWLGKIFEIADKYGNDLTLMHCNNAYPTPMKDAGLGMVKALSLDPRYKTGFSDHTTSTLTPALAVVSGATVIEKHFTLSRHLPGPDHPFALEPNELKEIIENIKQAELTIIPQLEEYSESEKAFIKARRSVVAKCPNKKGEIFTKNNITTKRPFLEGCIPASDFEWVLGEIAEKDYKEDSFI